MRVNQTERLRRSREFEVNQSRLQMLVAAEAVKGKSRKSGQAQEAVRDIFFRIETELVFCRRVRLPCCY